MRCEDCGKVIPDTAAYCAYCGAKAAAGGLHAPIFRFNLSNDKAVTLKDLSYAIDHNWGASQVHLYAGDFANWLGSMGRGVLADQVREIARSYPNDRELGLELFMRLVSDAAGADILSASPALEPKQVNFGAVPRDNTAKTRLVIKNAEDRGYLAGRVRVPPGVAWLSLSSHEFAGERSEITLTANTRDLPAGSHHHTRLMLTTPFETVETSVAMRVSSEWAALLRALATWMLIGSVGALAASGAGLILRELGSGLPWLLIYLVLAALVGLVAFGSIRTQDAALAIVLSGLIGVAMLLPIGLGVLVLSFVLAAFGYQTAALALTVDSTITALVLMTGAGGLLGALAGLFSGLRRLRRTPAGCTVAAALLALALLALATFGPSVAFGVFRPRQPLLEDVAVPVPYLAFAATLPASFDVDGEEEAAALTPTPAPTSTPTPTPYRRTVDEVVMLWDVVPVGGTDEDGTLLEPAGVALDAAIDAAGYVHLAYIAEGAEGVEGSDTLRYAVRAPGADTWDIATAAVGQAMADVSIALDRNGIPHIAYTGQLDSDDVTQMMALHVAAWDAELETWTTAPVDGTGGGRAPSLAFDTSGVLHVAYFGGEGGGLKLARYVESGESEEGESAWQSETVDAGEGAGQCPALAFDAGGLPHIAYVDGATETLRYARYIPTGDLPTPAGDDDIEPTATVTPRLFDTPVPEATGAYTWLSETIGTWDVRCDVALALDAQTGARHVLFYEADNARVYEALYTPGVGRWHFNRVGEARPLAEGERAALSITLDVHGGVQMTFNGPTALRFVRETPGNVLQSAVIDGPSVAQQVLIDGALRSHVVYLFRGGVWDATLTRAPERATPTPPAERPTIGPSATPYITPTPAPTPFCGDGICQEEDAEACPDDCQGAGWTCGNGLCEDGEDGTICPADCTTGIDEGP